MLSADSRWSTSAGMSAAAAALQALSQPTRLAILHVVLSNSGAPVAIADLARTTGSDVRAVSKEVVRLLDAGLLRREDDGLVASVEQLGALSDVLVESTALVRSLPPESSTRRFLTYGRVTDLPKRPNDRAAIAVSLASLLPDDREMSEAEVNEHLSQAGDDVAGLRRLLVDLGLVTRHGGAHYRKTSPEA